MPRDRLEALPGRTAVARRAELLEALAAEVGAAGGRCRALAADLTLASDRRRVGEVLERPEVTMLVNNAGVSNHGELVQTSPAQAEAMVALNLTAMAALSRRAADASAGRGRGAIVT